jgi:undecaprenyl-diphosphatase
VGIRWRRLGAGIIGAVLVMQLVVLSGESTHSLQANTTGAAVGCAVLLAFGRPTTRPRLSSVVAALRGSGLPATDVVPIEGEWSDTIRCTATLADGHGLFVRVFGTDQLFADLLRRLYRLVHLRNVGDERPFWSLRRSVEHEALVSFRARDVGVRTPHLRTLAEVGQDSFLLAYDLVDGRRLDRLDPDRITDHQLRVLWEQVDLMHRHRIAHRDLRLSNVVVDGDGATWFVGFGFSEIAAGDALLRADVAQLLTSLSLEVGVARAVGPAVDVLGPEPVSACLGRLQPAALVGDTAALLKARPGLLDDLRHEIERRCGVGEPPLEPIVRFGGRQLLTVVMLVGVVYFLAPQFADLPGIVDQIRDASWIWVVPALLASAATYLAAGGALLGSVPGPLPVGSTAVAQVASSFASAVAPAGLGGMALNVRFLQRQGVDPAVATSSVGLDTVAGFVTHVALIGIFVVWAGRDALGDVELPSPRALLIGVAVVVAIAVLTLLLPSTRRLIRTNLVPILGKAAGGLKDVLTTPGKVALLLGGSVLVTFCYLLAFECTVQAFGVHARFATIGTVYLVGTAIATVAPTPGGLGATEAALIGGLVAVGVGNQQAVPAVFLFRIVTFWIPILPGWIAFTWLRRTERL